LNGGAIALVSVLAAIALAYIARWWLLERAGGLQGARKPRLTDALVGLVTNFFDTLGIGSFAPTTAYFKLRARMPDDQIPGTLNAGQALPTITQALIFIAIVSVDLTTLISMILAAVMGAWLGVAVVSRLSRRAIQVGMAVALLCAALLFLASNLHWIPGGGDASALHGPTLLIAVAANFLRPLQSRRGARTDSRRHSRRAGSRLHRQIAPDGVAAMAGTVRGGLRCAANAEISA
jgi:hypothetical protein